jgi:hypothetical protein
MTAAITADKAPTPAGADPRRNVRTPQVKIIAAANLADAELASNGFMSSLPQSTAWISSTLCQLGDGRIAVMLIFRPY